MCNAGEGAAGECVLLVRVLLMSVCHWRVCAVGEYVLLVNVLLVRVLLVSVCCWYKHLVSCSVWCKF